MDHVLTLRLYYCLAFFFVDAAKFRAAMRRYSIVVSGSVALHFFTDDVFWRPTDLDLFVSDRHFDAVVDILRCVHGFRLVAILPATYDGDTAIPGILKVAKLQSPKGPTLDLVCSAVSPLYPIAQFWGSHLFNIITADYACSAYPDDVFGRRAGVSPIGVERRGASGRERFTSRDKYAARGYSSYTMSPDSSDAVVWREFGDARCVTVTFSHEHRSSLPASLLSSVGGYRVIWTVHQNGAVEIIGDAVDFPSYMVPLPVSVLVHSEL